MPRFFIIIILAAVVLIFSIIRLAIKSSKYHFECPECGEHFQVSFVKYFFAPHGMGSVHAKCPKCGYSGMMTAVPGKE